MKRFFSPPSEEINKLRPTLTSGEKEAIKYFHKNLNEKWEMYIKPHLNGLRPSLVLLNPEVGIALYEIIEDEYITDKKLFIEDPIDRIIRYKNETFELYCPRIMDKAGYVVITAGIIFVNYNDTELGKYLSENETYNKIKEFDEIYPIIGKETFQKGNIHKIFPAIKHTRSKYMNETLARDLRSWLIEPDSVSTQRTQLELDAKQKTLINTRTETGYRRIKGPAGSGKSLIIGARAAKLALEEKNILVVTYNITLMNYLKGIAEQHSQFSGKINENITWINFHYLCKRICLESGCKNEYYGLWPYNIDSEDSLTDHNNILTYELPALVDKILLKEKNSYNGKYDAVLVDEGQDFFPNWWSLLRKLCKPGGEMLLAADTTQDIYGASNFWTDKVMEGAGFRGNFVNLDLCYRMPPLLIDHVAQFAEKYLPNKSIDIPQKPQYNLDLYPCKLKWIQTDITNARNICFQEIMKFPLSADPMLLSVTDITFLTKSREVGFEIVDHIIKNYKVKIAHTLDKDHDASRKQKVEFFMQDAKIKATTLHSFKGWESRAIILYIGHKYDEKSLFLAYTGMTRLKKHLDNSFLTVISAIDELEDYGKTWENFEIKK